MIFKTDSFDQVGITLFSVFQIFADNLFKTVDVELLLEVGIEFGRVSELFIGSLLVS